MYLLTIDFNTGLIKDDISNDSWKGIRCFKELVERDGNLKSLTAVAQSVDYLSIYSHYKESDRPIRVIEEIYGSRTAIDFKDELIQECVNKYKELQFNPDLEQERIFNDRKISLLEKINLATEQDDDMSIDKYSKQLESQEATVEKFNKRFDRNKAIDGSVANSGYSLSRIENDIKSRKNSKFLDSNNAVNPNKLRLED